jgi:Sulfotransferase family
VNVQPAPEAAPELQACCLFIGYPRSGHSLVGALLDAHPDVALAHQADALRLLDEGMSQAELVRTLVADTEIRAAKGRRQGKYLYVVDGWWQGRTRTIRVVGDANSGKSTPRIGADPAVVERAERHLGVPIKLVHIVRNPYDNIATLSMRREHTMTSGIQTFEQLTGIVEGQILRGHPPVLTIRHDDLIADAAGELARICEFIGIEPDPAYLEACASIVFASPHKTRETVEWTADDLDAVEDLIARRSFLAGFSF